MLVAAGLLVSALPSAAAELPSDQSARALSALERAVEHSEIAHQDSSARAAARSSVDGERKVDSQSTLGRSIRLVDRGTEVDLPGATLQIRFRDDSVQEAAASNGTLTVFGSKSSDYNYAAGSINGRLAGYTIINSANKSSFEYEFLVNGAPAVLEPRSNGGVAVYSVDGTLVNAILPAWAVDATDKNLSTSYSVNGNILRQEVNLQGATFPVVADPQTACDPWFCTVEFNRSETKTIADNGWQATGVISIGCGLLTPGMAVLCGAIGGAVTITASQAHNQGECVGIRTPRFAGQVSFPVIYNGSNCR
ncbi:hypothetical protein [Arthrobacter sp. FW306-2-2C-D06B]|uniref:hypothetical protein n=1 Tax=Arthrobacter sp. FW306-2-2C-D06B TaxID=2879618 RepID=UPI001F226FAF|nr:hypothetical protein [Arthrobacter sp. FW306-2-2C-D06B]UKA59793.1 hypothetical protein LFT47_05465 [Arthrobacter sp. FW306-2-2C-D06B]